MPPAGSPKTRRRIDDARLRLRRHSPRGEHAVGVDTLPWLHRDPFDRLLVSQARAAGMKYAVLTAKHHEGFCLWDSAFTDFKSTRTPYGRDLLEPFVEAFRAEGLRLGLYYSLLDWHHPDFTIDIYHPLRDHPDAAALNSVRQMPRYAEYVRNQVQELLERFGPDILWCDFSYPTARYRSFPGKGRDDWESEKLLALMKARHKGALPPYSKAAQDIRNQERILQAVKLRLQQVRTH